MNTQSIIHACGLALLICFAAAPAPAQPGAPLDIGSRLEPLWDTWLIAEADGARLRLHEPALREVVLTLDQPWEGNTSTYFTIMQDDDLFRMYYRGSDYDLKT